MYDHLFYSHCQKSYLVQIIQGQFASRLTGCMGLKGLIDLEVQTASTTIASMSNDTTNLFCASIKFSKK